jgi:SRSO17 transposase
MAADHSVDPGQWLTALDDLLVRVGGRVRRIEPRKRLRQFVTGMMAGLPRVNCWTLAEHAGESHPRGMGRFLSEVVWDHDGLLVDVQDWALGHLGERDAILVIDETGEVKKGSRTVGVQRQYTGTAGRIENAQVAVYLTYTTDCGHTLRDRALSLPRSWAGDDARRAAAGVPAEVKFATKPALAATMIRKAWTAGVPAARGGRRRGVRRGSETAA